MRIKRQTITRGCVEYYLISYRIRVRTRDMVDKNYLPSRCCLCIMDNNNGKKIIILILYNIRVGIYRYVRIIRNNPEKRKFRLHSRII